VVLVKDVAVDHSTPDDTSMGECPGGHSCWTLLLTTVLLLLRRTVVRTFLEILWLLWKILESSLYGKYLELPQTGIISDLIDQEGIQSKTQLLKG